MGRKVLSGLSEIRQHLYRNETRIYYVDVTNFNLMGIDEWVRRFQYINYNDCFDGMHSNIFIPPRELSGVYPFDTLEEVNNYLLGRPEVQAHIRASGAGQAVFLYFNEQTLSLCKNLDLEVIFPALDLRREFDSKVSGTRLAERVGARCVPNVLGHVRDYEGLRHLAGHLGEDLVIQSPYGDSGETTWFVSSAADWDNCAEQVAAHPEVKIMKRIRCRQAAIEACATRCGTIVGPLLTEVVGFEELTPYPGGWAGNEVAPEAFSAEVRETARRSTQRLGDEMYRLGYRGYFEVDYLFDVDAHALYLGEINPRISGASSMTNLAAFAHADAPLFLFHLMEFRPVDFQVDVDAINLRWADPENMDAWGNLLIKHTADEPHVIRQAPPSGVWRLGTEGLSYVRPQTHRRTVDGDDEAFFLRIGAAGDVVTSGDELGIIVVRGRLLTDDYTLTPRSRQLVSEFRRLIVSQPL